MSRFASILCFLIALTLLLPLRGTDESNAHPLRDLVSINLPATDNQSELKAAIKDWRQ